MICFSPFSSSTSIFPLRIGFSARTFARLMIVDLLTRRKWFLKFSRFRTGERTVVYLVFRIDKNPIIHTLKIIYAARFEQEGLGSLPGSRQLSLRAVRKGYNFQQVVIHLRTAMTISSCGQAGSISSVTFIRPLPSVFQYNERKRASMRFRKIHCARHKLRFLHTISTKTVPVQERPRQYTGR